MLARTSRPYGNRSGLWRVLRCWLGHVDPMGTGVVYGESLGVG